MDTHVYLSKKGMKELKRSIIKLEQTISTLQHELRELGHGDSREQHFERSERLSRIEMLEGELAEKRCQLARAKLLPRKRDAVKVALGSVVDLIDTKGRLVRYTIVSSLEANPSDGRISAESPLGKSLLGRSAKDIVQWGVKSPTQSLQLVRIH